MGKNAKFYWKYFPWTALTASKLGGLWRSACNRASGRDCAVRTVTSAGKVTSRPAVTQVIGCEVVNTVPARNDGDRRGNKPFLRHPERKEHA